jgi:hypothetical protein
MKTFFRSLLVFAVLAAGTSLPAQQSRLLHLGVTVGSTVPLHDNSRYDGAGFSYGVHAMFRRESFPLGLRLEALHNHLDNSNARPAATTTVTSAGLSLEFSQLRGADGGSAASAFGAIAPWFSLGTGAYHIRSSAPPIFYGAQVVCLANSAQCGGTFPQPDEIVTKIGWNAGAGLRMPLGRHETFVEARYHLIKTPGSTALPRAVSYAPISIGFRF